MTKSDDRLPRRETILAALQVACQAPSLYNSQPWRWEVEGHRIRLYQDFGRLLPFTDTFGRQAIMSCGAALHHARVAFAALGWATAVRRFPSEHQANHLATIEVTTRHQPTERDVAWAVAISRRWTNRGAFVAAIDQAVMGPALHEALAQNDVVLTTMNPGHRPTLAEATARSAGPRRYDATLVDELRWWAGQSNTEPSAVPGALLSAVEPGTTVSEQCLAVTATALDHATVLVLSTEHDGVLHWLSCGEALSAVLLTCTAHGFATCPLSHLTDLPESRGIIARLLPDGLFPQVLVRVGMAAGERTGPLPSRLPLSEVLSVVDEPPSWSPLRAVTLRDLRRSTSQ